MSSVVVNNSALGNGLQSILMADDIQPGDAPSYQLCKAIYEFHPLGSKMAEAPLEAAQSQERQITIPRAPDRVKAKFLEQWKTDGSDRHIYNTAALARVYGIASLAILAKQVPPAQPIDPDKLSDYDIAFNVLDPLNTAGSLVLNQDPNALDFQKISGIAVNGIPYHRSRACVIMNENPIYIGYTQSAFGYVGRSVFQRALYPLKSFINTMVTDDMISVKAGVIITKMQSPGSIVDNVMLKMAGIKRVFIKQAVVGNVVSVGIDEAVESLNLQNLDGAFGIARTHILKNCATAGRMPAVMLENETLTEGFGEGTEDAKIIARYVDGVRIWMNPLYVFMDAIIQRRAWNREFYATIQRDFPKEYGSVPYETALYDWMNSFEAVWPSLLKEPDSEQVKTEKVKLEGICSIVEVLLPGLDPENKGTLVEWIQGNVNSNKIMFPVPLDLDIEALIDYEPPEIDLGEDTEEKEPAPPKPMALRGDSSGSVLDMLRTRGARSARRK